MHTILQPLPLLQAYLHAGKTTAIPSMMAAITVKILATAPKFAPTAFKMSCTTNSTAAMNIAQNAQKDAKSRFAAASVLCFFFPITGYLRVYLHFYYITIPQKLQHSVYFYYIDKIRSLAIKKAYKTFSF